MRKIDNIVELRAEKLRLQSRKLVLENDIKFIFSEIKEDFAPIQLLTKGAGKYLKSNAAGVIGSGAGFLTDFILRNLVLRNAGFLTKLIIPFLAKNVASNYAEDHKSGIAGWVLKQINKFRKQPDDPYQSEHTFI